MKRRPFFLLEVLIAALLVGVFAFLSIHGAFRVIYQQKKLLKAMEESIDADRRRMEVVEKCWPQVEKYLGKKFIKVDDRFQVKSKQAEIKKYYQLEVKDTQSGEVYKYLVEKHTAL